MEVKLQKKKFKLKGGAKLKEKVMEKVTKTYFLSVYELASCSATNMINHPVWRESNIIRKSLFLLTLKMYTLDLSTLLLLTLSERKFNVTKMFGMHRMVIHELNGLLLMRLVWQSFWS